MVTGTLFTVWLRIIHNIRHANFLVLALLGTLRDRAHPKSMFQNQVLGERICRCGDLSPEDWLSLLLPEMAFTSTKPGALSFAAATLLEEQPRG